MEPRTLRAGIEAAMTPPGSTRSEAGNSPAWKYHQGTPFCVLTTVVSSPISGCNCGASCVRPCAFTPRKMTSAAPAFAQVADDARMHVEIAVGAEHAKAALLHGAQVRAAGEERDVLAGARQSGADVAADRARAGDQKFHLSAS